MIMIIMITLVLLFLWLLTGELGFFIWRRKIFEISKPKLATEYAMLNMKSLAYRNRFRLIGPIGLFYILNYYKKNNIKG